MLALMAGAGALVAFKAREEERGQRDQALRNQFLSLSFLSERSAAAGNTEAAIRLALEALGNYPTAIFSPDGTRVLTAGENSDATLWDARTGSPRCKQRRIYGCKSRLPERLLKFRLDGSQGETDVVDPLRPIFRQSLQFLAIVLALAPDRDQAAQGEESRPDRYRFSRPRRLFAPERLVES